MKKAIKQTIMPGSSLWLVPPEDSELYRTLHALILHDIPSLFHDSSSTSSSSSPPTPPAFTPHVTLTADTVLASASSADPQAWLDGLSLPTTATVAASPLRVKLRQCDAGKIFYRKLTLLCERTEALADLAAHCRAARFGEPQATTTSEKVAEAAAWIAENYTPHLSLM